MSSEQPFDGITVIEFGQFVAVPYCAQLLADGGAYVVKVEPLEGEPTRHLTPLVPGETRHFLSRNRGKHSLPMDLRHPMSAQVLEALLAKADVLLVNLRPGLPEQLGLDYETLSARHPRLVAGYVTAFGTNGPDRGLAGMDYVVQARSGLMASLGKVVEGMPSAGDSPIADFMCAVSLSYGVASALFRRERTGRGGRLDVSLLSAAMALQTTLFTRVDAIDGPVDADFRSWLDGARAGGIPFPEQLAHSAGVRPSYMANVYYRTYETSDSAVAVACASPALQRRFTGAIGIEDTMQGKTANADRMELLHHYEALRLVVEAHMRTKSTAEWQRILEDAGLPVSPVFLPVELLTDEQVHANNLLHQDEHWALGPITTFSTPIRLDGEAMRPGPVTAPMGSETRTLLLQFGMTPGAADRAIREGAVLATERED